MKDHSKIVQKFLSMKDHFQIVQKLCDKGRLLKRFNTEKNITPKGEYVPIQRAHIL